MSLSRYKWNVRFGELREWLSQPTWTKNDADELSEWFWVSMERFKAQFIEQALPYIQSHPNGGRLKKSFFPRDQESILLLKSLPGASVALTLFEPEQMQNVDLIGKPITEVCTTFSFFDTFMQNYEHNISLVQSLNMEQVLLVRVSGGYEMSYLDPFDSKYDEISICMSRLIEVLLKRMNTGETVQSLIFSGCGLIDEVVIQLTKMKCLCLKELVLNGNRLTDRSAFALAQAHTLSGLERLSLGISNEFSDEAKQALFESPYVSQAIPARWFGV